jgi:hypothetical protein
MLQSLLIMDKSERFVEGAGWQTRDNVYRFVPDGERIKRAKVLVAAGVGLDVPNTAGETARQLSRLQKVL